MTSAFANLQSLLRLYASFSGSRGSDRTGGVTLFDGGTASAYENYALADPTAASLSPDELAAEALAFFSEGAQPHIWPLFPGAGASLGRVLETRGAVRDAVFFDMSAETGAMRGFEPPADSFKTFEVIPVSDPEFARAWADAAWYGFDSDGPAPDSFVSFVNAMIRHPDILLCALRGRRADPAFFSATGMLARAGGSAGIYYIATRPESRRRGLGLRVMDSLLLAAGEWGYDRVSLLATPSGRPLYETCGFVAAGGVEIYRFGDA